VPRRKSAPFSCRVTLADFASHGEVIVFEGIAPGAPTGLKASRSASYQRKKQGFYARFFFHQYGPDAVD